MNMSLASAKAGSSPLDSELLHLLQMGSSHPSHTSRSCSSCPRWQRRSSSGFCAEKRRKAKAGRCFPIALSLPLFYLLCWIYPGSRRMCNSYIIAGSGALDHETGTQNAITVCTALYQSPRGSEGSYAPPETRCWATSSTSRQSFHGLGGDVLRQIPCRTGPGKSSGTRRPLFHPRVGPRRAAPPRLRLGPKGAPSQCPPFLRPQPLPHGVWIQPQTKHTSDSTLLPLQASLKDFNALRSKEHPAIGAWLRHFSAIAAL